MPRSVVVWREAAVPPHAALALPPDARVVCATAGTLGVAWADALRMDGASFVVLPEGAPLPESFVGLVDLRALDAPEDARDALTFAKRSLFLAQQAAPRLRAAAERGCGFYVMALPEADASPAAAVSSSVSGLLKTAALEWPGVRCLAFEVPSEAGRAALRAAQALSLELAAGLPDREVRMRSDMRTVPVLIDEDAGDGALLLGPSDVLVCSGGARGVTATTLLALARAAQPRLLLLGRTRIDDAEPPSCVGVVGEAALKAALIADAKARGATLALPAIAAEAARVLAAREIRAFLDALTAAGSPVRYAAVDVRDGAAVADALAGARTAFGPITGIVHGAGVLADKLLEHKTADQVDRVMDTKVLGLLALLDATARDPLRTVCLFSSVAGRSGNVGQVDYAMANEALTHLGRFLGRTRPQVRTRSFMWGPWEGGMVTPALKKQFLERGVQVLSHSDGARHFVDELRIDTSGDVEVVFGGELGAGSAAAPAETRARFTVDAQRFSLVADHAIADVPVLPVVLALELMLRTRRARVVEDLRVLRGVRLPRFSEGGHALDVRVDGAGAATLAVDGGRHSSYVARLAPGRAVPAPLARGSLEPSAFSRTTIYETLLFHGPRFQLIDEIIGASADGLVAQARGVRAAGWPDVGGEAWVVDAAALDAALQSTLLWARHVTGGAYLPTSIARVVVGSGIASGSYRCVVAARGTPELVAHADVVLINDRGEVAYRLEGVGVHRLADDAAFTQPPSLVAPGAQARP